MLILDRKENQAIMIGDDIEITIVNIKGDHVKIGINAPNAIKVYRQELFAEIQNSNREALKINPDAMRSLGALIKNNKDNKL